MKKGKPESVKKEEVHMDLGAGIFGGLTGLLGSVEKLAGTAERLSRRQTESSEEAAKETDAAKEESTSKGKVEGILSGLVDIAERLNELSEKGESLSEKGEFTFPSKKGGIKGVYGFTLKTGLGEKGDHIKVEPFGNIRKDKKTGEAVVQEINEPLVDVFEDEKATTLVAEMPGVGLEDIHLDVQDDVLTIAAQKGEKKYRKEILLNHLLSKDRIEVTCNNGIVTIRCGKAR
ncbi:MAG TPA: Hsp20/alpha crystallin family protein [Rectinemataceae bacterium]|nr:Hsp20/alpha crystallin family protein [Rectinemataceae bacterium]